MMDELVSSEDESDSDSDYEDGEDEDGEDEDVVSGSVYSGKAQHVTYTVTYRNSSSQYTLYPIMSPGGRADQWKCEEKVGRRRSDKERLPTTELGGQGCVPASSPHRVNR